MKKYLVYIILFSYSIQVGRSQSISQKEIMRSGKYYYYVSYQKDSIQARDIALKGLLSKVANDKKTEKSTGKSGKIILDKVRYYQLKMIEQYKIVAYINKNDIKHPKQLSVTEITVKTTHKNDNSAAKLNDKKIIETPQKKNKADIPIKRIDIRSEKNRIPKIKNSIIKNLLNSKTAVEMIEKIKKYKNEGKIQVVTKVKKYSSKYNDKDFYKIFLDKSDKSIKAFLDKNSNRDLRTGKIINEEELNQNLQLWLKTL